MYLFFPVMLKLILALHHLHFVQFNAQSINANQAVEKPSILKQFIIDYGIDVLGLSETWLSSDELPSTINSLLPDGFCFIHIPRPTGRGGGVGFIYNLKF